MCRWKWTNAGSRTSSSVTASSDRPPTSINTGTSGFSRESGRRHVFPARITRRAPNDDRVCAAGEGTTSARQLWARRILHRAVARHHLQAGRPGPLLERPMTAGRLDEHPGAVGTVRPCRSVLAGADHRPVLVPSITIDNDTTSGTQQRSHRSVGREHFRLEVRHVVMRGLLDDQVEQVRSEPTAPLPCDDHCELAVAVGEQRVSGLGDEAEAGRPAQLGDNGGLPGAWIGESFEELRSRPVGTEEPEIPVVSVEPVVEVRQRTLVSGTYGPHDDLAAMRDRNEPWLQIEFTIGGGCERWIAVHDVFRRTRPPGPSRPLLRPDSMMRATSRQ